MSTKEVKILKERGFLLEDNTACTEKIDIVSGAITAPFAEMLWSRYNRRNLQHDCHYDSVLSVCHV